VQHDTEDVSVLYIAGIGRSGSTLLCRTLGAVPGFVGTGELMRIIDRGMGTGDYCSCGDTVANCDLWGRVWSRIDQHAPAFDFARLEQTRKRITEGWGFLPYLFLRNQPEETMRDLDEYRRFLTVLYRSIRAVSGARVIVDASKNLLFLKMLTETPGVRLQVLHLVRDSRGVAHSLMKRQPRPGTAGRQEHFRQFGPVLGPILWSTAQITTETFRRKAATFVRVRYEDFVANPRATIERVVQEVCPTDTPEALEHVDRHSVRLGVDHLIASNPNRSRRGTIDLREDVAWRSEMSAARRSIVTSLTFPLLLRYGYRTLPYSDAASPVGVATR
jgi:hypothetical protein